MGTLYEKKMEEDERLTKNSLKNWWHNKGEPSGLSLSSVRQVKLRALQDALRAKQNACEQLATQLRRCSITYTPPTPDFDKRRVMGTICKLMEVCDPIHCTALDAAAGTNLYSVVVDTDVTGLFLLRHGKLMKRTTFVPLNRIIGFLIDRNTVQVAQRIAGGAENVQLALDLVSFDSIYRPAMEWVFGSTLVCRDSETAKMLAFHPDVNCRTVSLDGDVFDPDGVLIASTKVKVPSVLAQLRELKEMEEDMKSAKTEFLKYFHKLEAMQEC